MTASKNAARVAVKAAALPNSAPRDVFDCIAADISRKDWEASLDHEEARAWSNWLALGKQAQPEAAPLDLHDLCDTQTACGFTNDLTLSAREVQAVTARLRGITAISALFIAAGDSEALKLGEWMQGGLTEALHALAEDAHSVLEWRNEKAKKGGAA